MEIADVAEVEVDMETLEISVLRITNATDVGRAIHPINVAVGGFHRLPRREELVALAEVELIPQTGIDELISAAHEAEMRVVVAGTDHGVLAGMPADDTIGGGEDLARGVRRLIDESRAAGLKLAPAELAIARAAVEAGFALVGVAVGAGLISIATGRLRSCRCLDRAR